MAKLGSLFRRFFTSLTSDNDCSSSPLSSPSAPVARKSIVLIQTPTESSSSKSATLSITTTKTVATTCQLDTKTSQSCSTSPRTMTRQPIIYTDSHSSESQNSNFLSSYTNKNVNRRLSAPLIVHASTQHQRSHRSALLDQTVEEALISPLQRLSLSSSTGTSACNKNNSVNSLGASGGSISGSLHNDVHSSSLNLSLSNSALSPSSLNHISPTSGRCKNIHIFCYLHSLHIKHCFYSQLL